MRRDMPQIITIAGAEGMPAAAMVTDVLMHFRRGFGVELFDMLAEPANARNRLVPDYRVEWSAV